MDNDNSIEYALWYPIESENRIKNISSVFLSTATVFYIIPAIVLLGYLSQLRNAVLNNDDDPPTFENYNELYTIGKNCLIAYTPIFAFTIFFIIAGYVYTIFAALSLVPILLWPIVSVKYSESYDYKDVYDKELLEILASRSYVKHVLIYLFAMVMLLTIGTVITIITFGAGLLLLVPILVWIRPIIWTRGVKQARNEISESH